LAPVSGPEESIVTPPAPVEAEAIAADSVPVSEPDESTAAPPVPVAGEAIAADSVPVSELDESTAVPPVPVEAETIIAESTLVSGADKSIVTLPALVEADAIAAESTVVNRPDESIITLPAVVEAAAITTAPAPASEQDTSPTTPLAALKSEPVPNVPDFPVGSEASSTKQALFSELDKSFYAPPIPLEAASSAPPPPPPVEARKPLIKPAASAVAVASPPKPPAPIKPSTAAAHPRSPSSKWEIVYILLAGFLILATVAVVGYISIQKKVQAQALALATARDLQQTLVIAQTLTNLPLPTLIPTWTPSPSSTGLPTSTFTSSPTAPPTQEFTPTRTPIPADQIGPVVGLFAPDFNLTELASGKQVTLAQYVGQPVFIFFWATWCLHCNNEMGSIETISQTNKAAGLVVLTVNAADDLATVTLYRANHNLTIPILLDPNSIFKNAYNISLDFIPLHFFIDSNGKIRSIFKGELTLAELQSSLGTILQPLPTSTP
jgi:peroxiredoxin